MDIENLTDDELDQLASKLAGRLPTGRHGEKIVTTRRQLLAATLGGSAGVAALVKLGIDPATAQQAAGQVGTQSSPEDVFAFDLDVQNGAEFNGTDLSGVGSLSTDNLDVTPLATGSTQVPANSDVELGTFGVDSYQTVLLSLESGGGGARVYPRFDSSFSENQWRLVNDGGSDITVNWAVVELSAFEV